MRLLPGISCASSLLPTITGGQLEQAVADHRDARTGLALVVAKTFHGVHTGTLLPSREARDPFGLATQPWISVSLLPGGWQNGPFGPKIADQTG
jgi:hypothetical protein